MNVTANTVTLGAHDRLAFNPTQLTTRYNAADTLTYCVKLHTFLSKSLCFNSSLCLDFCAPIVSCWHIHKVQSMLVGYYCVLAIFMICQMVHLLKQMQDRNLILDLNIVKYFNGLNQEEDKYCRRLIRVWKNSVRFLFNLTHSDADSLIWPITCIYLNYLAEDILEKEEEEFFLIISLSWKNT